MSNLIASGLAWGLLMIPVAWSTLVWKSPVPSEIQNRPELPGLVFDQYLVDLREVPPQEIVSAFFRFQNAGEETLRIVEMVPSCGCLSPRIAKFSFKPGERGLIQLPIQTFSQTPGRKEYQVLVRYEDPTPRETTVTLRVVLPDTQVLVSPPALVIYQSGSTSSEHFFKVIDKQEFPLEIVKVECDSELFEVEALNPNQEDKVTFIPIRVVTKEKIPPGKYRALITIYTTDPVYKVLRVPLMMETGTTLRAQKQHKEHH